MEKVQEVFVENGTIWVTTTSGYTGADRLTAEDLGKREDEIPSIFKLGNKYLISDEWRKKLSSSGKVRSLMTRVGTPFLFKSSYFIPDSRLTMAVAGWGRIEDQLAATVEDLIACLDLIKAERIEKYPVLNNATWPTPEQIRQRCKIRRLVVEIQGVSAKETDPNVKIQARNQFREELDNAYEDLKNEILRDATSAIIGKCEDISKKILDTGDKITEATLKSPRRIIDDYLNIAAIFGLDEVKSEVTRLQSVVDGASAKSIRDNAAIAKNFAIAMKTIGEKIGDLTGINAEGRQTRKVDFDE